MCQIYNSINDAGIGNDPLIRFFIQDLQNRLVLKLRALEKNISFQVDLDDLL